MTVYFISPIGKLKITASESAIRSIYFIEDNIYVSELDTEFEQESNFILDKCLSQLDEYFFGDRKSFDLPMEMEGTDFQRQVWNELLKIPYGTTISYLELSEIIGNKKTIRAVAKANAENKIPIIIPCHRVIGTNGNLTGYSGGLKRKRWLLDHETEVAKTRVQLSLF